MRPLKHFIVRIDKKFKDEIKLSDETTLKLITKFNEFEHRYNYGQIVSPPVSYRGAAVGQVLYFHHHVVMEQAYDLGENLYMVNYDPNGGYSNHAIAVEDEAGDITMLGDWCFVLPPDKPKEETTSSGIVLKLAEEPKLEGELLTLPRDSEWIGTKPGDLVGYTKNSEYKMELIDGTSVYRMRTSELVYVKEEEQL